MVKIITSRNNNTIRHLAKLKSPLYRATHHQFVAEGIRACTTIATGNCQLIQLYATEQMYDKAARINPTLVTLITESVLAKVTETKQPSGIIGLFARPIQPKNISFSPGLVLAGITDPGNMGTLIRTAVAMNCTTIYIITDSNPNGCDPWSKKAVHASAGTVSHCTIVHCTWQQLIQNKNDIPLVALVPRNSTQAIETITAQSLLIVGNEAHGIPEQWIKACDIKTTIPMKGNSESLNAAIAGAIALYVIYNQ